jgi:hypothetical protein
MRIKRTKQCRPEELRLKKMLEERQSDFNDDIMKRKQQTYPMSDFGYKKGREAEDQVN